MSSYRFRLPAALAMAAALAAVVLAAPACRQGPPTASATLGDLRITGGFAYRPITPASGAAYFRVRNTGTVPDTLLGASSPVTRSAMFHGGDMGHLEAIVIVPGSEVVLEPGGTHLMLTDYARTPEAGDSLPVELRFARAGTITLALPVRRYTE
jgi:copper(I)-binding protein